MTVKRQRGFQAALFGSLLAIAGCSSLPSLPSIPGFGGDGGEASEEEKAGRIDLALGDQTLEADPAFVDTAVILPDSRVLATWTQSGASATKVVGHVQAAPNLEVEWRARVADGTDRSIALTTAPVSDGTNIFLLDGEQKVKSISVETGRTNWTEKLVSDNRRDKRGLGGGVAVTDQVLIVASGYGFVAALNSSDGSEIWRRDLGSPVTGSPTVSDGKIYVVTQNNEIFALEQASGQISWSDQAIAESARVLASPSVAAIEDLVVAPFSSGEVIAYLAANGRRLWNEGLNRAGRFTPISNINDIASRPILSQGLVYAASQSGVMAAIDGRTGRRVWNQNIGSIYAPAVIGEYVFIAGVEGQIACLSINNGGVIWVEQLQRFTKEKSKRGRISYAGPVIASNRVIVVSSEGELLALSPQTGEEILRLDLRDKVFLEPIVVGDRLIILTDEGRLISVR